MILSIKMINIYQKIGRSGRNIQKKKPGHFMSSTQNDNVTVYVRTEIKASIASKLESAHAHTHAQKLIKPRNRKDNNNGMQRGFDYFSMWPKTWQIQQDADLHNVMRLEPKYQEDRLSAN